MKAVPNYLILIKSIDPSISLSISSRHFHFHPPSFRIRKDWDGWRTRTGLIGGGKGSGNDRSIDRTGSPRSRTRRMAHLNHRFITRHCPSRAIAREPGRYIADTGASSSPRRHRIRRAGHARLNATVRPKIPRTEGTPSRVGDGSS